MSKSKKAKCYMYLYLWNTIQNDRNIVLQPFVLQGSVQYLNAPSAPAFTGAHAQKRARCAHTVRLAKIKWGASAPVWTTWRRCFVKQALVYNRLPEHVTATGQPLWKGTRLLTQKNQPPIQRDDGGKNGSTICGSGMRSSSSRWRGRRTRSGFLIDPQSGF